MNGPIVIIFYTYSIWNCTCPIKEKSLVFFLGVFNAEFERDRTRWGVFGGILLGYESTPQMTDWNFFMDSVFKFSSGKNPKLSTYL
ncbi:Uncharacterized protein GNX_1418 [Leptospira interrogans serovar Canicola]|nr:Uncharacterized protein GNX_1418 [Leptospira interrogans serovar Canicola]